MRREDVWINGRSLRDVDARIISVRVIEPETNEETSYAQNPGRSGQRLLSRYRASKKIQVQFAIRELHDYAKRTEILDAVNAWAQDGVLEVSTRHEQMARVIVTKYASAGNIAQYTDTFTIEFEMAGVPYWQDATPTSKTLTGTSASGQITVRGSAETVVEAVVSHTSGTIDTLTINVGGSMLAFTGLGVAANTDLIISHDERGLLTIKAGSVSKMSKRTAASDDDLFALPGAVDVSMTAGTSATVLLTARGRYR